MIETVEAQSIDAILTAANEDRESFFKQAEEAMESTDTARRTAQAATPAKREAAPAVAKAEAPEAPASPSVKGKLPGAPKFDESKPAQQQQQQAAKDDADIPREYKPGTIKAPHWEKLHARADAAQRRAEEAEAKIKDYEAKLAAGGQVPPEALKQLETIQKERDEILARLEAVAIEKSPRFEQTFKPRVEAAINQAKHAVGPDLAAKIEQVFALPEGNYRDEQFEAMLGNMNPLRAAKLTQAIAAYDSLTAEKAMLAAKGSEVYKQWTTEAQQQQQQQQQARVKEYTEAMEAELKDWSDVPFFKPKQGDTNHNSAIENRIQTAKNVFSGNLDARDLAKAALWAALGPDLVAQSQSASKRISELEAELNSLRGAQPGLTNDAGGGAASDDDIPAELSYADAIARRASMAGLLR